MLVCNTFSSLRLLIFQNRMRFHFYRHLCGLNMPLRMDDVSFKTVPGILRDIVQAEKSDVIIMTSSLLSQPPRFRNFLGFRKL